MEQGMREATTRLIELAGGPRALADAMTAAGTPVSRQTVYTWLNEGRIRDPLFVRPAETAVQARVTRYELRPDVYGEG